MNEKQEKTPITKVGYIRISNAEKQDPESQRKLMVGMGITDSNIFTDFGSGSVEPMKRKAYRTMIAFVNEHPTITEIVMSEYSRLGRTVVESLSEFLNLTKRGIKITSLSKTEDTINNIPLAFQPAVIGLMMASAQGEREHIIERTRWGLDNARSKGKKLGRPRVEIDFNKLKETMDKYGLKELQAMRVLGLNPTTVYKRKREVNKKANTTPPN